MEGEVKKTEGMEIVGGPLEELQGWPGPDDLICWYHDGLVIDGKAWDAILCARARKGSMLDHGETVEAIRASRTP